MKIFVMVDMEGISGIVRTSQVNAGEMHYEDGRRYLTQDTNACVAGCFEGGAKKVVVVDAHSSGFNFLWHDLDPRAQYIQGDSEMRMPSIDSFDGLILLGYHAMAGTQEAILEHTWSSRNWQNLWINGNKAGEIALDAGIAGDHGVPTIMVSGDDKACREARRILKGVATVQVKKGLACMGGQLLSMETAHRRIREGAAQAVGNCKESKPYRIKSPVTMRLECVSRTPMPIHKPDARIIDGRTFEVKSETVEGALRLLL
jgi:D-amino peptidase